MLKPISSEALLMSFLPLTVLETNLDDSLSVLQFKYADAVWHWYLIADSIVSIVLDHLLFSSFLNLLFVPQTFYF